MKQETGYDIRYIISALIEQRIVAEEVINNITQYKSYTFFKENVIKDNLDDKLISALKNDITLINLEISNLNKILYKTIIGIN